MIVKTLVFTEIKSQPKAHLIGQRKQCCSDWNKLGDLYEAPWTNSWSFKGSPRESRDHHQRETHTPTSWVGTPWCPVCKLWAECLPGVNRYHLTPLARMWWTGVVRSLSPDLALLGLAVWSWTNLPNHSGPRVSRLRLVPLLPPYQDWCKTLNAIMVLSRHLKGKNIYTIYMKCLIFISRGQDPLCCIP